MSETPSASEREQRLERVLADYLHAVAAGAPPDRAELLQRHPDLAADLASFFRNRDALERIAGPIKQQAAEPETIGPTAAGATGVGAVIRYFGDYELLEEIARGGMGVVYKARQVSLNRVVALKMILAGQLASAADVARFRAEAEAAGHLDHPNIVPIYEVGEHEGQHYFSMKLVEGGSLSDQLNAIGRQPHQAGRLLAVVARAVHHAHQRGILHRDLKPSNILLQKDEGGRMKDESGKRGAASDSSLIPHPSSLLPMITDFGLARRVEGDSGLTQSGAIVGTPSYMAPEQARAEKVLTTGIDVYSLGAILYELLTGRPPFQAATPLDTLMQVLEREPVSPRSIHPRIDRDLETISLKCLGKEPQRRYDSAAALAEDLERFCRGEPIQARPVGRLERAVKWVKRHPAVSALVAAVVLVTLAGLGGIGWAYSVALSERDRAEDKAEDAKRSEKEAVEQTRLAVEQKQIADHAADDAWANQYVAHMNRVENDWVSANINRILETLEIYRRPPAGRKDVRGWEWYYQDRLCHQELLTLKGRSSEVPSMSVAFSPDGTRLASAHRDGSVNFWDAVTGKQLFTLKGHKDMVSGAAFSPDGKLLASASIDGLLKLWDTSSGQELRTLKVNSTGFAGVAFSPDGRQLAWSTLDGVKLWNVSNGQQLHNFTGRSFSPAFSPAFSPDGTRLATGTREDATVKLWDVASAREIRTLTGHKSGFMGGVPSVAFSLDGTRLASASTDGTVKVWDADTGQELRTLKGHAGSVASVAFSPDGMKLASAGSDQTVRLWDAASGRELRIYLGHTNPVASVAFSPDGTRLASTGSDSTVKLWDTGSALGQRALKGRVNIVSSCVAFSPDGSRFVSASSNGTVKLWDTGSGQELYVLKGHLNGVEGVAFSPDGKRLASASTDTLVKLWDVGTGQEIRTLKGHTKAVKSVVFSADGTRLVSGSSYDGTVKVWDTATGQELHIFTAAPFGAFSPGGTRLISGGPDGTFKLWDVATGQELRTLKEQTRSLSALAFNWNGARLALARGDGTVKLWDTSTGQELRTLKMHTNAAAAVAFTPDGSRLASASYDGTVKLWDTSTGQELRVLNRRRGYVRSMTFSPDGRWLAVTGADDGAIHLWDARPLTPAVQAEVESVALLEILFAKPLPKSAVLAAIKTQHILTEAARQKALELIDRFHEETDPQKYHAAAWPVLRHPYANVFMAQNALAQMKAACGLAPNEEKYRIALAIAHYRLGKFQKEHYQDARQLLAKCDPEQPATLAFQAMTEFQLGHKAEAQTHLVRLRKLLKSERWANDQQSQAFRAEAEALLHPAAGVDIRKD